MGYRVLNVGLSVFFREVNDARRILSLIYRLNVRVFVSLWSEGLWVLTLESHGHVMYVAPRSISWRQAIFTQLLFWILPDT